MSIRSNNLAVVSAEPDLVVMPDWEGEQERGLVGRIVSAADSRARGAMQVVALHIIKRDDSLFDADYRVNYRNSMIGLPKKLGKLRSGHDGGWEQSKKNAGCTYTPVTSSFYVRVRWEQIGKDNSKLALNNEVCWQPTLLSLATDASRHRPIARPELALMLPPAAAQPAEPARPSEIITLV